ncbi:hypothetical protein GQ54DRAFT_1418 [Martensiomyces pterosporus]|nr:hypothetical protein GQ54DRAFT_1418 [Martensiomyces pterosporus]
MENVRDSRDLVVIGVCGGVLLVNFLVLAYAFVHRSYLPLKSKNLPIMYLTYVAMVCWFIGSVYSNHSSYLPKSWLICMATYGWARMSLGIFLFVALFQFRVYQYIAIFLWKRRATGAYLWVPVAYLVLISLSYGLAACLLPQSLGFAYYPETKSCHTQNAIFVSGLCMLALQFGVSVALTFKARKINACFNEYREIVITITLTALASLVSILARWLPGGTNTKYQLATAETFAMFIASQVHFFIILGPPVYHSIVDKDEYLRYFIERMRDLGLAREYDLVETAGSGSSASATSQMGTLVAVHDMHKPPEVLHNLNL